MKKLIVLCFALIFSLSIYAYDNVYVYDGADLFYESEEIEAYADVVYNESGLLCVVVTDYGIDGMLNLLPSYACGATDMALLAIDMSAREYDIYQYNSESGEDAFRISYSESENILDSMLDDMADGYYDDAAITFIKLAADAFADADFVTPGTDIGYEYVDYSDTFSFEIVIYSLIAGLVIGGISVLCVYLNYKNKVHGSTYPLEKYTELSLTDSKDTFITKTLVATTISSNSGSSSGGGVSRGGGGGGARMGGRSF